MMDLIEHAFPPFRGKNRRKISPVRDHLWAFFDETGHARSSAFVGVAGFVSTGGAFSAFDLTWREVLACAGVPSFHAREFAHSIGPFSDWNRDEPKRRRFLKGLLGAITRARLLPIAACIDTSRAKTPLVPPHQHMGGPYFACLLAASRRAIDHARNLETPRVVDFVVARTSEYRGEAFQVRDRLLEDPLRRSLTGSLEIAEARDVPALQAADLLAYEMAKEVARLAARDPARPRWPFQTLLEAANGVPFLEVLRPDPQVPPELP
ncbi:MAG: hypothetical protein IT186_08355 [Acidobacteria bacterium]|nr:hypothetical protein [Acidobacteriota bacterium]